MEKSLQKYVNDYFDKEVLKTGDRGTVYVVRNRVTKQRGIYREFSGTGEVYRKMQGIDCPYLPKIEAVEEQDGTVCVLEEYIQGDTLAFLLEEGAIPDQYAKDIVVRLCGALDALHSLGIVHRDIKPENVILRGEDAVLIDFDASRLNKVERNTDTQAMGTAGYAAPEQYGFAQTDARADIYALGVLLNEMLIRKHPSKKLADGNYLPIITKCIEVNIDKRYSSATELTDALEMVSRPEEKPKRAGRKFGWIIASAVSCILLCGVLLGVALWRESPRQTPEKQTPDTLFTIDDINDRLHAYSHQTPFWYDLDGDGRQEKYVFAVGFYETLPYGFVENDVSGIRIGADYMQIRDPFPCVWKYDENGELVHAPEFAELLEDPKTELRFLSDWETPQPIVHPLICEWNGGLRIFFGEEHYGTWIYEVSAKIGEHELTAAATSSFYQNDGTD